MPERTMASFTLGVQIPTLPAYLGVVGPVLSCRGGAHQEDRGAAQKSRGPSGGRGEALASETTCRAPAASGSCPACPSFPVSPTPTPSGGCLDPLPKVRLLNRVLSLFSSTASASPSAGSGSTKANTAPQEEIPGKEAHPEESLVPQEARLRGTQESGCSHCPWPRNPTQEAQLPTPVS